MTALRDALADRIWHGRTPFAPESRVDAAPDLQGWNAGHPYLRRAIDDLRPGLVVEIGVWKGASAIAMAERMRETGLEGAVLAVDTFLGSSEHWLRDKWFDLLPFHGGMPALFHTFAANVAARQLEGFVLPLPLDSLNAAAVVAAQGLRADVLHIDAGHDFASVSADLKAWWPLLRPGGVLVGDDYFADGDRWPEVREAFHAFFGSGPIENENGKCWIRKPEDASEERILP